MGQDNRMRKCLTTLKAQITFLELHEKVEGKHFFANITINKISNAGYWWPTLFKDILQFFGRVFISYMNFVKVVTIFLKIGGLKTKSLAKLVTTLS
jgi:hypothetical protein